MFPGPLAMRFSSGILSRSLPAASKHTPHLFSPFRAQLHRSLCTSTKPGSAQSARFLSNYRWGVGLTTTALALGFGLSRDPLACEPSHSTVTIDTTPSPSSPQAPPPADDPKLNVPELSFGAVAGICAGIFVKKGLKLIAFFVGGIFVLLQFLHSQSFVSINWGRISTSWDHRIDDLAGKGDSNRLTRIFKSFLAFLTADFQGRATFIAGFLLGLRL